MKAEAAGNSGSPSLLPAALTRPAGGALLCNATALVTKSDSDEEGDIYSDLGM